MLNAKVVELLNNQIVKEFYSAYLYLEIADFYDAKGLDGFKHYYTVQAKEEQAHAIEFIEYLQRNHEKVVFGTIDAPCGKYNEIKEPLEAALKHEIYVTGLIHNLYSEADKAGDIRTTEFLDGFVREQSEEEDNAKDLIDKFDIFATNGSGLHALDADLAKR